MPKKFPIWSSYEELHREYLAQETVENFGTKVDPRAAFKKFGKTEDQTPKAPSPGSEHAIFMYAVNKIQSLIEEEIKTLNESSKQRVGEHFEQDCHQLIQNFAGKVSTVFAGRTQDRNIFDKISTDFLADAAEMVKKYEPQIESNESWAPFLKNVGLLLSVIGTLPALFSMASKAVTGRYAFFDETKIDDKQLEQPLPSTTPKLK